jgi:hypothetical protein
MTPAAEPVLRSLDAIAGGRRMTPKDCRDCRNFEPAGDGLAYGWCGAHKKHIKLYHPAGAFFSQCQMMSLRRVRPSD